MTQRLIAAVSAQTAEGVLYELDLRLRASGNKAGGHPYRSPSRNISARIALDLGAHGADARPRDGGRGEALGREVEAEEWRRCWPCRAMPPR